MVDWFRVAADQLSVRALTDVVDWPPTHGAYTAADQVITVRTESPTEVLVEVNEHQPGTPGHRGGRLVLVVNERSTVKLAGHALFDSPREAPSLRRYANSSTSSQAASIVEVKTEAGSATGSATGRLLQFLVRIDTLTSAIFAEINWWQGRLSLRSSVVKYRKFTDVHYLTEAGYYSLLFRRGELITRLGDYEFMRLSGASRWYDVVSAGAGGIMVEMNNTILGFVPNRREPIAYQAKPNTLYDRQFAVVSAPDYNGETQVTVADVNRGKIMAAWLLPVSYTNVWTKKRWIYHDDRHSMGRRRVLIIVFPTKVKAIVHGQLKTLYRTPTHETIEESRWLEDQSTLILKLDGSPRLVRLRIVLGD